MLKALDGWREFWGGGQFVYILVFQWDEMFQRNVRRSGEAYRIGCWVDAIA